MVENTKSESTVAEERAEGIALDENAGIASAAAAESAEVLNLLDDQAAGSCCGGSCCN